MLADGVWRPTDKLVWAPDWCVGSKADKSNHQKTRLRALVLTGMGCGLLRARGIGNCGRDGHWERTLQVKNDFLGTFNNQTIALAANWGAWRRETGEPFRSLPMHLPVWETWAGFSVLPSTHQHTWKLRLGRRCCLAVTTAATCECWDRRWTTLG